MDAALLEDNKVSEVIDAVPVIFDVAIIGSGPAGTTAALNCARKGLKVIVFEEHEEIGLPLHCGECVSKVCIDKMPSFPLKEAISLEAKGVRVIFPNGSSNILSEQGYVLEKDKFEQWLAREAEQAGAKIELSCRVHDAKRENNEWKIFTTKGDFSSKIIIDASGVSSFLSIRLNLNAKFKTVVGIQYDLLDVPRDNYLDFYIWPDVAPNGYLWVIPKKDGHANVGLVTNQNNRAKAFLDEFVKRKGWQDNKIIKTFGGLIPASGPLEKTFDEGLLLVGDAAGFTSPLFEGGTHLSIQSAIFASQIAKKAIAQNNFSVELFSEYQNLWKKEFPDYNLLVDGKRSLYNFSSEELNDLSSIMPKELNEMTLPTKLQVGLKLLFVKPHLFFKGALKTFASFRYSRAKKYGW